MTRDEAEETIAAYESLIERAVEILRPQGPPFGYVSSPEWARIEFEGDDVVLSEPRAMSDYDCCVLEEEKVRFPAALLFMNETELAEWRKQARAEYERQQQERERQRHAAVVEAERAQYEALKQKFGS